MIDKNRIEQRLKEIGFQEENIQSIINDVTQVIVGKTVGQYFTQLPQSEQSALQTLSPEELIAFVKANKADLPKLSSEEFMRIHDETWNDYFETISKK